MAILSLEERFWAKVDKTPGFGPWGDCWRWKASKNKKTGYGQLIAKTESGYVCQSAHVVSFNIHFGSPGEFFVLHKCDIRECTNDAHLFKGTASDNSTDMVKKGRHKPSFVKGSSHGMSKLEEQDIPLIRAMISKGDTYQTIAKCFGVDKTLIGHIKSGKVWAHIP